jgi:hypothetical protein
VNSESTGMNRVEDAGPHRSSTTARAKLFAAD